jgi:hypothetical protein
MASTFSSALNLELQASGENSGTWGVITNNNLQKVESAIKGYVSVAIASTSDSLATSDGSTTDEQSNAIIKLTGTLTGNTTMQCEAVETWYIVDNATTMGTHTLNFKPAGGTGTTNGLVAGSKHILYSDGSTMFDVLNDAGNITANGTLNVAGDVSFDGGDFIFNDSSADKNFTIESNGATHMVFVDGGNDRVGINNASPSTTLDVTGTFKVSGAAEFAGDVDVNGGGFTFNEAGAAVDFRAETDNITNALFIDGSADRIGLGTNSVSNGFVTIDQSSSTGAVAVISLDQGDEDQEFIDFRGTSASDSSASISSSTDEGGSKVGAIRISVNGTDRFIRIYDTAV